MIQEPHAWYAHYPKGVAHEIDPNQYSSIPGLLVEGLHKYKDHTAFENMGKKMTYTEVDKLSTDFAAYLQNVVG